MIDSCRPSHGLGGERHRQPSDPPHRAFVTFGRLLTSYRQLLFRKMSEKGIHPGQAFCLAEIAHNDGITQRDLAEALSISRPTLTVMLQKMEKSGLVERRADELDQRYTRIHLTAAGASTHDEMHKVMGVVVSRTFGLLSDHDNSELCRLLSALNDNMVAALQAEAPLDPPADLTDPDKE